MFYLHEVNSFGHALGLIPIHGIGSAGSYGAEAATAGTYIAQYHKGGGAFAPALSHIGTVPAFANSMEFVGVNQPTYVLVILSGRKFNP
jgi:hypothetical protein